MSTTFRAAVDSDLRTKSLSHRIRNEYHSTVRKWEQWGGGSPIEALQRKEIREFENSKSGHGGDGCSTAG
jgi:hypothetical protein